MTSDQQFILDYLEHLSAKELGVAWNERAWREANEMRVWYLREVVKHPDWQFDPYGEE